MGFVKEPRAEAQGRMKGIRCIYGGVEEHMLCTSTDLPDSLQDSCYLVLSAHVSQQD